MSTTYVRHPKYWEMESRTLVYAVEGTIYRFPLAVLKMMSPPLTAIFDIPPPAPDSGAGPEEGTEEHPIIIPGVTARQLNDFLAFFFKSDLLPPLDLLERERREELGINLLHVGSLWDIQPAREYAISVLEDVKLSPARTLMLARKHRIPQWIDEAVRKLIPVAGTLDHDDALMLGPLTLNIIFQANLTLHLERVHIAYTAPTLRRIDEILPGECNDHFACQRSINQAWWSLVGRKVLHPNHPIPLGSIHALLDSTEIPGMSPKCREDMIIGWATNWYEEEQIKAAAVQAVIDFHKCYGA